MAANPEAVQETLEKQEIDRIKERMSLKHKNTSKWIRDNMKRGKNIDPSSRQDIFIKHSHIILH